MYKYLKSLDCFNLGTAMPNNTNGAPPVTLAPVVITAGSSLPSVAMQNIAAPTNIVNPAPIQVPPPDYRVSLTRAASVGTGNVERVIFSASPNLTEERQILYKNINPIQGPGSIYQYAYSNSRTFNITAKLISRSVNEATRNLTYIQYLRAWSMPVFGTVGNNAQPGENILGAPPAILFLTAYSPGKPSANQQSNTVTTPGLGNGEYINPAYGSNLYQIPVAIQNLSIPFPDDVDYIPTLNNYPVPIITTVTIALIETHSPNKFSGFNLQAFKNGTLLNF
jgi:hypothetical protein